MGVWWKENVVKLTREEFNTPCLPLCFVCLIKKKIEDLGFWLMGFTVHTSSQKRVSYQTWFLYLLLLLWCLLVTVAIGSKLGFRTQTFSLVFHISVSLSLFLVFSNLCSSCLWFLRNPKTRDTKFYVIWVSWNTCLTLASFVLFCKVGIFILVSVVFSSKFLGQTMEYNIYAG